MNNVYENEMRFAPFLKFIDKYKNLLILLAVILLGAVTYFVVNNQLEKKKSEQAALVYKEWLVEISQENPNNENLNNLLDKFLNDYKNTGYTQLALLSKANFDANSNNYMDSLDNFKKLIEITNGFNGNRIYNKIGRVSASRLLLSMEKYDEALEMIDLYSSSDTNGYIHELTGDILLEQGKIELAISQYEKAANKYTDESSQTIVAMKISNIDM
ncbi:tetratricopeptide repeat protein [Gammaproteobacteria bacterium]|jgi:predicted negative regulator of RcsB-dependent stress response|nr:tetratricopeptide repeat protein [Gammaproteobacteria bacterium]|tara:strand:+ start:1357 stop:2001 length:645 start_codon:yes stop_codon:yes gene_type:complete